MPHQFDGNFALSVTPMDRLTSLNLCGFFAASAKTCLKMFANHQSREFLRCRPDIIEHIAVTHGALLAIAFRANRF